MIIEIFKNTNFGNNDLVWNIPEPGYNFNQHEKQTFRNIGMRFPLLTTTILVNGQYDFNTSFYDYMIITDDHENKTYYFINTILAERNVLIFSVTLDAITTYNVLGVPISGVLVRKHDTNPNETRFDYPTALSFESNFENEYHDVITFSTDTHKLIESAIDLSSISPSISIAASNGGNIVLPKLPRPSHNTDYHVASRNGYFAKDRNNAFTLYDANTVSQEVLDTVRGLSGDGAISDSYSIPTDAVTIAKNGAKITRITGVVSQRTTAIKLENGIDDYVPKNLAIKGAFHIDIMSIQEKTRISFPAWNLQRSITSTGHVRFTVWVDPKPSGAPYCAPGEVLTLHPLVEEGMNSLTTLESKSVRGGQWLKNPLVYTTGKGEIFSTIETRLQREQADYEKKVSMHQLEITKRERDIQIAQADYNYQSGLASSILGMGGSLLSKDLGGALSQAKGIMDSTVNRGFVEQMRSLQSYQLESEKQLINMAHTNNLKNLNIQESIRRVVAAEVVHQPNESMGSYEEYNGFMVIKRVPDLETLKAKDMEYSKYGYPVYETVTNFVMLDNLRQNHTVFQFEKPFIELGGQVGDMVRTVLQSGIRILSKKYTIQNILNNPKRA